MERPVIRAAEFRVGSSRKTLQIAKGAYYPSLRLGAGYSNSYYYNYSLASGTGNASLADQWAQNGAESVGLSLSIPIFNRMATRNRVRSAQLNIKNQELLLDQANKIYTKKSNRHITTQRRLTTNTYRPKPPLKQHSWPSILKSKNTTQEDQILMRSIRSVCAWRRLYLNRHRQNIIFCSGQRY
jgi:hypothetical protein